MDKLVRFCREVAIFGLTVALIAMLVALIWDGTLDIRIGFTSFVIGVTVISLKTSIERLIEFCEVESDSNQVLITDIEIGELYVEVNNGFVSTGER